MTDKTKTTEIQVTYTLEGSFDEGYRIERTERGGLTVNERLACLFADVRTLQKSIVNAAVELGRVDPRVAELDANTVILQLVARTLQHGTDSAQIALSVEDRDEPEPVMH